MIIWVQIPGCLQTKVARLRREMLLLTHLPWVRVVSKRPQKLFPLTSGKRDPTPLSLHAQE